MNCIVFCGYVKCKEGILLKTEIYFKLWRKQNTV